jgi:hypothetical protein
MIFGENALSGLAGFKLLSVPKHPGFYVTLETSGVSLAANSGTELAKVAGPRMLFKGSLWNTTV